MKNLATTSRLLSLELGNLIYRAYFPLYRYLYFAYKNHETEEIKYFRNHIKKGMCVVDVGANIGFYTLLFSKLVGEKGKVFAFEPEKLNFKFLKQDCAEMKNIVLNNIAIGNKSCKLKLYVSRLMNVDHLTYKTKDKRKSYFVECVRLDDYFSKNEKIDLIKIDTQGFEYRVLIGMKSIIKRSKNIMIVCEFSSYDLLRAGTKPEKFFDFFKKMGLGIKFFGNVKDFDLKNNGKTSYYNLIASRSIKTP